MRSCWFFLSAYISFLPSGNMLWNWVMVICETCDKFEGIRQILVLSNHFLSLEILVCISLVSWIFFWELYFIDVKAISFINNYSYMFSWRKSRFDAKAITGRKTETISITIFGVNFMSYVTCSSYFWRIQEFKSFKLASRNIGIVKQISISLLKEYINPLLN